MLENFINRDGTSAESFDGLRNPQRIAAFAALRPAGVLRKTFAADALPLDARQVERAVVELLDEKM